MAQYLSQPGREVASPEPAPVRERSNLAVRLGRRGEILGLAPSSLPLFGYLAPELVNRPVEALFDERSQAVVRKTIDRFALGVSPARERPTWYLRLPELLRAVRKDRTRVLVQMSLASLGETGVVMLLRDMGNELRTEHAEAVLAETGRVLLCTFDFEGTVAAVASLAASSLADCAVVDVAAAAGSEGTIRAAARVAGRDSARMIENRWRSSQLARFSQRAMETRAPVVAAPVTSRELPGLPERDFRSVVTVPLMAGDRALGGLTLITEHPMAADQDFTLALEFGRRAGLAIERARRLHQAEATAKGRAELMKTVAHELANALGAVNLFTRALIKEGALGGVPGGVGALAEATERVTRLLTDLREEGQTGRPGHFAVEPSEWVSPQALVAAVVEATQAGAKGRCIQAAVAPGLAEVRVDQGRIRQVFVNVIDNAIKFSPPSTTITIGARGSIRPAEVVFFVRDAGIGISKADQRRLFERGFQVNPREGRGWGMGLAICKEIVEAHGGTFSVDSRKGAGSTFAFALPVEPPVTDQVKRPIPRPDLAPRCY